MTTSAPTRRSTRRRPMQLARPLAAGSTAGDALPSSPGPLTLAASASLGRASTNVELLVVALDDDLAFFAALLRRGMLDAAVEHARLAATAPGLDRATAALVDRDVVTPLLEARRATTVADAEPERLAAALAGALAAARALVADP